MKRRLLLLSVTALMVAQMGAAKAAPPLYEPRVLPLPSQVTSPLSAVLPPTACTPDNYIEKGSQSGPGTRWDPSGAYANCQRLKIVFGPIWAKPGQNDVLIQPVTFEKPMYPGYLVRFKPDLVSCDPSSAIAANHQCLTSDAVSPKVEDLHLHHGTWLNACLTSACPTTGLNPDPLRSYGNGPWIASGEEKTIIVWPRGYGLKVQPSDTWMFLHMIHNATPQTFPVWVTYDLDFVPQADAEALGPDGQPLIRNTRGLWLDVGECGWHATKGSCTKDLLNPIFDIQRGYGSAGTCTFPNQNCASQNTLAGKSAQQGIDNGTIIDDHVTVPEDGSLVLMGGHVHFGGLADRVYLERDLNKNGTIEPDEVKLIHISDALYWDQNFDPTKHTQSGINWDPSANVVGGSPSSWDMVMTAVSKDLGWSVRVQKGDRLRIEGVYDSTMASWYEQMGIVMTWLAPGDKSGVKLFPDSTSDPIATPNEGLNNRAINPATSVGYSLPGSEFGLCTPSATVLCVRGQASHARVLTSGDHWSCTNGCPAITPLNGPAVTDIHMGAFTYGEADVSLIPTMGVPTVKLGGSVTFWNADTADYMWHTVTRCAYPCSGTTSASYPIPDGAYDDVVGTPPSGQSPDEFHAWQQAKIAELVKNNGPDPMDFDSGQIGNAEQMPPLETSWKWTPTRTGTFTFFCRIHPSMRGAIRVIQ